MMWWIVMIAAGAEQTSALDAVKRFEAGDPDSLAVARRAIDMESANPNAAANTHTLRTRIYTHLAMSPGGTARDGQVALRACEKALEVDPSEQERCGRHVMKLIPTSTSRAMDLIQSSVRTVDGSRAAAIEAMGWVQLAESSRDFLVSQGRPLGQLDHSLRAIGVTVAQLAGDVEEAQRHYRFLDEGDRFDASMASGLAIAISEEVGYLDGLKFIKRVRKSHGGSVELLDAEATILLNAGLGDEAILELQKELRGPIGQQVEAWLVLGRVCEMQRELLCASDAFGQGMAVDPAHFDAAWSRARVGMTRALLAQLQAERATGEQQATLEAEVRQIWRETLPALERAEQLSEEADPEILAGLLRAYLALGERRKLKAVRMALEATQ